MGSSSPRHVGCRVPGFKHSFALLASVDASLVKRAVIFVHGFSGSAGDTWTNFIGMVDDAGQASVWWRNIDLYFFDYHWASIFRQVAENTRTLRDFVETIWPTPQQPLQTFFGELKRRDFAYEELTLVGHSEGGLLVRKLILNAAKIDERLEEYRLEAKTAESAEPPPEGILKADLRLFAPAIAGESLSGILGIIAALPFVSSITRGSAAKSSMSAESVSVSGTRGATEELTSYLKMSCFRAHILWADRDGIVLSEEYRRDHVCAHPPRGTEHDTICKPKVHYVTPMTFIEKGVVNGQC